ncbi:3-hydroxyacyl-ACP dehydratase [Motilimonas sp. E26]|uniref:ApeI family dehydratase n=1 Tax=Motilimonas sp. E26 TaxID=2865674 RepID=UPI001E520AE8|nr:3-hydroxyacyl-ACP dehydratase [Motilimonas sp. E26]MCE0556463.1 3-hydroxyacyl-ACP dehydratase [Motilimonas sp. E26]
MTDYPELIHTKIINEHQAELSLTMPTSLRYFDGHFAASPILPGVAQIEFVMFYGRTVLLLDRTFAGMEVIKFQQLIKPDTQIQLDLKFDPRKSKLYFCYHSDQGLHASGRILLS